MNTEETKSDQSRVGDSQYDAPFATAASDVLVPHTPGPWTLGYDSPNGAFEIGVGYHDGLPGFLIAARADVHHRAEESRANGRLLMAAPDLLAALKEVAHHADDECGFMVSVRAAIAKAEGKDE